MKIKKYTALGTVYMSRITNFFVNLCKNYFEVEAEWIFSACVTANQHAKEFPAQQNVWLLEPASGDNQPNQPNQILMPTELNFCDRIIYGIKYIYILKEEIKESRMLQEERWKISSTIASTRDHHQFVPMTPMSNTIDPNVKLAALFLAQGFGPSRKKPGLGS